MNFLHTAIAAGIVIPGVVVAGIYLLPGKEERQAEAAQAAKMAAVEQFRNEEESHLFVLQPFYISGGVFIVELEARGAKGQSVLCSNLPLLHDAVVTALYGKTKSLTTEGVQQKLKQYGEGIRRQVNSAFDRPMLKRVVLTYSDLPTFNANYMRKKSGSAKRCLAAEKAAGNPPQPFPIPFDATVPLDEAWRRRTKGRGHDRHDRHCRRHGTPYRVRDALCPGRAGLRAGARRRERASP